MQLPSTLYKYVTADTAKIVLQSGRLRWSSPLLFNDPIEFQRLPRFDPSLKQAMNDLPKVLVEAALGTRQVDHARLSPMTRQMYDMIRFGLSHGMTPNDFLGNAPEENRELDKIHEAMTRSYLGTAFATQARVMCLTANSVNPAMWANYAGNGSGCVLGFRHIPAENTPFLECRSVHYSNDAPILCSGLDFYLYADKHTIGKGVVNAICYTKREEWRYEEEWRAITWRDNEGNALFGDYPFLPDELESVTFGLKSEPQHRTKLIEVVRYHYPQCLIQQIEVDRGELVCASVQSQA
jgi:hypothetical protein